MLIFAEFIKLLNNKNFSVIVTALLLQFFLALPFTATAATAALTDYFRESWNTRQGLPHNTINSISQTPDGYLWFATWEGVARYNGREFKVFGREQQTGLPDSGIRALHLDPKGRLLVGGSRGGLALLQDQQWRPVDAVSSLVNEVRGDAKGQLWVGTEGGGLFCLQTDGSRQQWTRHHGLPSNTLYSLLHDDNEGLWVGTAEGLAYLHQGKLSTVVNSPKLPVFALAYYQGKLYLGTERGLYQQQGTDFVVVQPELHQTAISRLLVDHQGDLWIGTVEEGVFRLSNYGLEQLTAQHGMPNNRVLAIYEDNEHSIWLGTNGGLFRLRDAPFTTLSTEQGLPDNFVRTVLQHSDGSVWIGTARGVARYKDGQLLTTANLLPKQSVLSLAETTKGDVLIGTYSSGVFHYSQGKITILLDRNSGLLSNEVRAILPLPEGDIWFGTAQGLNHYQHQNIRSYTTREGLPADFVIALHKTKDVLWVGTGTGVTRLVNGQFESLSLSTFDQAEYAFDFYEQPEKNLLWLATDRGLVRYRLDTAELAMVGRKAGMPFDKFFQVQADAHDNFWLSSNRGILRISRQDANAVADGTLADISFDLYGESDGMLSAQANGGSNPAAMMATDGSLWFATASGVSRVQPSRLDAFAEAIPPVVLEELLVNGVAKKISGSIELPPDSDRVELHFAGLGYVMPERIQYRSRLVGFDANWLDRGKQNFAEYTNLAPGRYEFLVQAANSGGPWSEAARIELIKHPHWWQTRHFQWLGTLCSIAVLLLLLYWRMSSLRKSEQRLKRQVAEKTAELQQKANSLQAADEEKSVLLAQLHQQTLALALQARQDGLTGLANRRAFDEVLSKEFMRSQRLKQPLALAFIDIDHFKQINDTWSHNAGDVALVAIAEKIRQHSRSVDCAARWGGEEFALLMPSTSLEQAQLVCERLRLEIMALDWLDIAEGISITVSIGIAISDELNDAKQLLFLADQALYQAKQQGRNRVCAA
ncbi:diguanylate cyclase (GGDEF) domain-containing protein [Rheinheimera sp. A13L]|uniref:ligand-binding sensor domain-containing diguanylate cyclase n=1 Tax=Rheinheimera sp. A13L TaxID=506534 RepID=UPI0002125384|nr:ligand-binding sensor domain-containing diguanylate cyclase [Rheinheimera sp. A13L]EGM79525.1 diguanylate cyclase (GGDEF) domain-containing protein [Rheinheimera sp. A13L]